MEIEDRSPDGGHEVVFDAVLRPHRSLGPVGFIVLMGFVSAVSFAAGLSFLLLGAWPVLGFFGLDVLLIYLAFRFSYRTGRVAERLRLDPKQVTIWRSDPGQPVRRWQFPTYWVRLEFNRPMGHDDQLIVASHGRRIAVGTFLSPPERERFGVALARALAKALEPARHVDKPSTSIMP